MNGPDERRGFPSASAAYRWVRCEASHNLSKIFPDRENRATIRGTKIHAAIEGKFPMDALPASDQTMAHRIMHMEGQQVEHYDMEGAEIIRETRYWWLPEDAPGQFSGQPDSLHLQGKTALVINYKTGWYQQAHASVNWQAMAETALVAKEHGVSRVHYVIISPGIESEPFIRHTFEDKDIKRLSVQILAAAEKAHGGKIGNAGEWCEFCPAKKAGVCPDFIVWDAQRNFSR